MLEIAYDLGRAAANFGPTVAVALGLVAVTAGLFVWLGGLGLRKLLVAIVGALGGAIGAMLITDRNIPTTLVSAAVTAILAVAFEQIVITILTAGLVALCCFGALAHIYNPDFSKGLRNACFQMPPYTWLIIAAVAAIIVLAASYFWRITSAFCCAAFGTLLIFAGMIVLLAHKGAGPVSHISNRTTYFAAVFIAMTAFGTFEQLLFCKHTCARQKTKKRAHSEPDEPDAAPVGWRNR